MTFEPNRRGKAVQPHYGRTQANRLGSLPTGISAWINGTEVVGNTYGRLETEAERKAFFDEFLKRQHAGFTSAWIAIYQTVDLIRQNDWYWQGAGFDSFDAFWLQQGHALFGKWAELEATYQYAHLAAPQLFEVNYDEAKAIAQQLAPFRAVPAAMSTGDQRSQAIKQRWARIRTDDDPLVSAIEPAHYIKEMNSPEFLEGFQQGQSEKAQGGTGRFTRFARLRRDAPEVADRFLAGDFIKHCKNGTVLPDLIAAEVAGGIRKEGQPAKKPDPLAYCKQLANRLSAAQLKELQNYLQHLLNSHASAAQLRELQRNLQHLLDSHD